MKNRTDRKQLNTLDLTTGALIGALYVVFTLISQMFGLASGVIQLRLSEALTILPVFTWAAVPGVTVGCFLANLLTGCALWDIVLGTFATFVGALGTYYVSHGGLLRQENPSFESMKVRETSSDKGTGDYIRDNSPNIPPNSSNGNSNINLKNNSGKKSKLDFDGASTKAVCLASLCPIISNTLIVPLVLMFVYGAEGSYPYLVLTVGIGEILSCGVLGVLLYRILRGKIDTRQCG